MRIIGERQAVLGQALFDNATTELSGPVAFIHTYVDMSNQTLTVNGTQVTTCLPAMGYSFAAGTTDGEWGEAGHRAKGGTQGWGRGR